MGTKTQRTRCSLCDIVIGGGYWINSALWEREDGMRGTPLSETMEWQDRMEQDVERRHINGCNQIVCRTCARWFDNSGYGVMSVPNTTNRPAEYNGQLVKVLFDDDSIILTDSDWSTVLKGVSCTEAGSLKQRAKSRAL